MQREKINGHTIEFFDNIEELPISQYHKYSRYMLIESGVGSDLSSVDSHISKAIAFIDCGDKKSAVQELMNMRQNIFLISNEKDIVNKAFLCLVKRVDNKEWKDFSDDGLERLYEMLNNEAEGKMTSLSEGVKKKIDEELTLYFPTIFGKSEDKNIDYMIRKRALLQADEVLADKDNTKAIEELTNRLLTFNKPQCFYGSDSVEISFEKDYERLCLQVTKEMNRDAKKMSVMEFYSAYEYMEKIQDELKKIKSKHKRK